MSVNTPRREIIRCASQVTAIGLRAWQTIACPVVAKITLYTVISGSLTALAFVRSNEDCGGDLNDAFFKLPFCPVSLLRLSRVDGVSASG